MEPKLKNKTPGTHFFYTTTMLLTKDLLQLVFLELDHGYDMLNFSEISHKSNQIFHQQIKIIYRPATKYKYQMEYMENNHHQKHGISRGWHNNGKSWYKHNYVQDQKHGISRGWDSDGQLWYEKNYYHDQLHGICREWHENGQLYYEHNYYHDQLHGICREWYENGQLYFEHNYDHGTQIEK